MTFAYFKELADFFTRRTVPERISIGLRGGAGLLVIVLAALTAFAVLLPDSYSARAQTAATPTPIEEAEILDAIYDAMGGDAWTDNTSWKSNDPLGSWYGVTTNAAGRVTRLNLASNNLTGSIPADLGKLTELTSLNLYNNGLKGSIPPELGNLSSLQTLSLSENALTGEIPSELGNLSISAKSVAPGQRPDGRNPFRTGRICRL